MKSLHITLRPVKEFNTSGRLGGVNNDLRNGTRPDPLFAMGAYTASDKRPVEKIVVWPRESRSNEILQKYLDWGSM